MTNAENRFLELCRATPGPWEADGPGFIGPKDNPIIECGGTTADCFMVATTPEMLCALVKNEYEAESYTCYCDIIVKALPHLTIHQILANWQEAHDE